MWSPPPAWRPTVRTWLGLLVLGLVLWLLVRHAALIFEVLAVLFAAFLVSLMIGPFADYLGRRNIPRALAVIAFYAVLAGIFVLLARLLVPVIHLETVHLRRTAPATLERAVAVLRTSPLLQDWLPTDRETIQGLWQNADTVLRPAFGAVMDVGTLAVDVLVVLVLAFFFVTDRSIGQRLIYDWIPGIHRARARRLAGRVSYRLTRWMWAQLAVAVYFAAAFSIVLALLHVPFALTIGVIGGVIELVPYLGGLVAFILASLSALSVDPSLVLWIALLYVIIAQTESHVLAPALYGRVTGLHPALVLMALFVGAKAAGLAGLFFAVPAAVVVVTLVDEARTAQKPVPALPGPAPGAETQLEKS